MCYKSKFKKKSSNKVSSGWFFMDYYLFGSFVPLFRGNLKWFFIMILLDTMTLDFNKFFFMFCYNKIYIKELLANAWIPTTDFDRSLLIRENIIDRHSF